MTWPKTNITLHSVYVCTAWKNAKKLTFYSLLCCRATENKTHAFISFTLYFFLVCIHFPCFGDDFLEKNEKHKLNEGEVNFPVNGNCTRTVLPNFLFDNLNVPECGQIEQTKWKILKREVIIIECIKLCVLQKYDKINARINNNNSPF